jgi:hypothetical protein
MAGTSPAMTKKAVRRAHGRHHPRTRMIQYSRDACDGIEKPRRTGYSAGACHRARQRRDPVAEYDGEWCGDVACASPQFSFFPPSVTASRNPPASRLRNLTSVGIAPPAEAWPVTVPGLIVIILTPAMFFPASCGSNSGLSRSLVPVRISVFALIEASALAVSPPKPGAHRPRSGRSSRWRRTPSARRSPAAPSRAARRCRS